MSQIECEPKNIEQPRSRALVLCFCRGNVLRSQLAQYFLELAGIHAESAALGNVSEQHFQDKVPSHIVAFMRRIGFGDDFLGRKIKQATKEMVDRATHLLVFDNNEIYIN